MDRAHFHESTLGVLVVSIALMGIAALENSVAPWAPYYVVYAALATYVPLRWKMYQFGSPRGYHWWAWAACPVIAIVLQAVCSVIVNIWYARVVVAIDGPERLADPIIAVPAMFDALFVAASEHTGLSLPVAKWLYLGFIVAWAGLGEELYFRGYVQGMLRRHHSARYSIAVATLLFAVRHYVQMLLLPQYPIFAASAWVLMAVPLGIVTGLIYEKTRSLWLPVVIHYLFNIIPFLVG